LSFEKPAVTGSEQREK